MQIFTTTGDVVSVQQCRAHRAEALQAAAMAATATALHWCGCGGLLLGVFWTSPRPHTVTGSLLRIWLCCKKKKEKKMENTQAKSPPHRAMWWSADVGKAWFILFFKNLKKKKNNFAPRATAQPQLRTLCARSKLEDEKVSDRAWEDDYWKQTVWICSTHAMRVFHAFSPE